MWIQGWIENRITEKTHFDCNLKYVHQWKTDATIGLLSQYRGHIFVLLPSLLRRIYYFMVCFFRVSWSKTKRCLSNYIFFILLFSLLFTTSFVTYWSYALLWVIPLKFKFFFGFILLFKMYRIESIVTLSTACIVIEKMVMNDQKLHQQ